MNLKINFIKCGENDKSPMVCIVSDNFDYGNIFGMYKTKSTQGHGIQCNNDVDSKKATLMCDEISNAIYKYMGYN